MRFPWQESWLQRSLEPSALEARRWLNADDASPNVIVGWCELERLLLSMLPQHSGVVVAMVSRFRVVAMVVRFRAVAMLDANARLAILLA